MFNLTRQEQIVVIFLISAIILGGGILYHRHVIQERWEPEIIQTANKNPEQGKIIVDIAGAVWRPGVYTLEPGSRVKDLIDKAAPRGDANLIALNLAASLRDGQKIIVPTKPATGAEANNSEGTKNPDGTLSYHSPDQEKKLNLNTATLNELNSLPGIGPIRAQAIIDYRNQHNGLTNIEDIKKVKGIGEGIFQKVKSQVTVY